jgi:hypothetical protein
VNKTGLALGGGERLFISEQRHFRQWRGRLTRRFRRFAVIFTRH